MRKRTWIQVLAGIAIAIGLLALPAEACHRHRRGGGHAGGGWGTVGGSGWASPGWSPPVIYSSGYSGHSYASPGWGSYDGSYAPGGFSYSSGYSGYTPGVWSGANSGNPINNFGQGFMRGASARATGLPFQTAYPGYGGYGGYGYGGYGYPGYGANFGQTLGMPLGFGLLGR